MRRCNCYRISSQLRKTKNFKNLCRACLICLWLHFFVRGAQSLKSQTLLIQFLAEFMASVLSNSRNNCFSMWGLILHGVIDKPILLLLGYIMSSMCVYGWGSQWHHLASNNQPGFPILLREPPHLYISFWSQLWSFLWKTTKQHKYLVKVGARPRIKCANMLTEYRSDMMSFLSFLEFAFNIKEFHLFF